MKKIILLATVAAMAIPATASAGESGEAYGNAGIVWYDVDSSIVGGVVRLGYNFMENFGVEGEGSIGFTKDSGVKIKSSFGGFAVGRIPAGDKFDVFGRVGYHTTNVGLGNASGSTDGVAWGVGMNYMFSGPNGVRLDYTRYEFGSGGLTASTDTISASYVRKF